MTSNLPAVAHNPLPGLPDYIVARIDVGDCWLWTGVIKSNGYGSCSIRSADKRRTSHPDRKTWNAHKLVHELLVGPVVDGLELDHLCRVRRCVNPDHMELVTRRANLERGHGSAGHALRTGQCKNGHTTWRERRRKGRTVRVCVTCLAAASRRHYLRTRSS